MGWWNKRRAAVAIILWLLGVLPQLFDAVSLVEAIGRLVGGTGGVLVMTYVLVQAFGVFLGGFKRVFGGSQPPEGFDNEVVEEPAEETGDGGQK